jgi:hypothetical protein
MIVQADREDQLAAARQLPKDVALNVPTAAASALAPNAAAGEAHHAYAPAPKVLIGATDAAAANNNNAANASLTPAAGTADAGKDAAAVKPQPAVSAPSASVALVPVSSSGAALSVAPVTNAPARPTPGADAKPAANAEVKPAAPSPNGAAAAAPTSAPLAMTTAADGGTQLFLLSGQKEMRVGERQRLMLLVKTATPLALAAATLKFDPRVVAVRGVTQGSLFGEARGAATPSITPSIDPRGSLLALIAPAAGSPITGMGVLVFVEVEAIAAGESDVTLDQSGVHLMSVGGQNVATQLAHTRLMVKP